jgi:methionyl-tRNA formyltransferase
MELNKTPFAFFGTPYVARDTLGALLAAGYRPEVVVTSPDAARGRGLEEQPCATKEYALNAGLPVINPATLDDAFLAELLAHGCQYAIVVAYGKILPQAVIGAFPLGVLNIHYSLLPKYRGASPVEAALLADDAVTGITIQRMAFKMDAGDMLAQERISIALEETICELRPRLISAGSELLIATLPSFIEGTATLTPQDHDAATFARKISKEEGLLSGADISAKENWLKYRAYLESPGTYFFAIRNGARIRVKVRFAHLSNDLFVIDTIVPEGKSEQPFAWLAQNGWEIERATI